MRYLRTASTRSLLATIAGVVAIIAGGTAIALAAAGGGPVPKPKPLANAIHDALTAPAPAGITARISFTNRLIDSSNIQGSDPILTGASGRLWLSKDRLRLELQSDNGDAQVVLNNGSFWVYDPSAHTVYEGSLPSTSQHAQKPDTQSALPSVAQIESYLTKLMQHVDVSGAVPSDVAHRPTYTVTISPKHDGGLLGSAQLAWDAVQGVPLRIAIYARGDSNPVLELKATDISYGPVQASDFEVGVPASAKVVKVSPAAATASDRADTKRAKHATHQQIDGLRAVARHLSFPLSAPSTLVGLPRQSVTLLDWGGSPAALVTYGQNLGGIAVIEQTAASGQTAIKAPSGDHAGLTLPTVSINGATGQELDTALGTVVRFTRNGVAYTVLGSVPAVAADAAARGL